MWPTSWTLASVSLTLLFASTGCDETSQAADAEVRPRADVSRGLADRGPDLEDPLDGAADQAELDAGEDAVPDAADEDPDGALDLEFDAGDIDGDSGGDTGSDMGIDAGSAGPCPVDMVLVPGGGFRFGPRNDPLDLPDFCIHRREVSAGEFLGCVADDACDGYDEWPACVENRANRPHQCNDARLDYPANWIDWFRAEQYCRWLGGRLPEIEEWEKAARGTDANLFPWGDAANCQRAQYARVTPFDGCVGEGPYGDEFAPVDSYEFVQSPYGAINLAGNVSEWNEFRDDPDEPPEEGVFAPARGGSYRDPADGIQAPRIDALLGADRTNRGRGFRCAQDPD